VVTCGHYPEDVTFGAVHQIALPGAIEQMRLLGRDWSGDATYSYLGAVIGRKMRYIPIEGL
jgi:hypothetical protein